MQLSRRLFLGTSKVEYSEAVPMEGYNTLFLDCTVFVANGAPDPVLKIYVETSNHFTIWKTVPVGGTAAELYATIVGYFPLSHTVIGQISGEYVRLRYETDSLTTAVIFSAGIDPKRIGV